MKAGLSRAVVAIMASAVLGEFGVGIAAAVPGPPHHIAVPAGIGVGRVMVLRPHRLDLFSGGRYRRTVYLNGQLASLSGLADAIRDPSFLARVGNGAMRVSGALIQRPHTNLVVGGAGVRTVELASAPSNPVYLSGTQSSVSFSGVTVTGANSSARAPRPYVSYGGFSVVNLTSSTFTHLGRPGKHPVAALQLGRGATLSASKVSFLDNVVGLAAANSAAVRLSTVTAARSSIDGITLRNAGMVSAGPITVSANLRDGLALAGVGTHLTTTGRVNATDNHRFGIAMYSGVALALKDARTHGNGVAGVDVHGAGVSSVEGLLSAYEPVGVRVDSAAKFTVDSVTATGDRIGISATAQSVNLKLHSIIVSGARTGVRIGANAAIADGVTVTGSGIGMQVAPTAHNVHITGLNVSSPAVNDPATTGAEISGTRTTLTDSRIQGARIAVEINGPYTTISGGTLSAPRIVVAVRNRADATTLTGVKITGGVQGISVTAHGRLALIDDVISGSSRAALHTSDGSTTVTSSTFTSLGTVIDAYAPVTVTDSSISGRVGVHIAAGVVARFTGDQIDGSLTGIHVVPGGHVAVVNSHVTGRTPISGLASVLGLSFIGPLPLHWLGAAGLALMVIALLLIGLSRSRERGHERIVLAPEHVTNRS